jgi:hypothetical protein
MRGWALATVVLTVGCSPAPTPTCTVCSGACVDLRSDTNHCGTCDVACGPGERCEQGSCVTTCAVAECGGACVDLQHDPLNCGACAVACSPAHASPLCLDGACGHGDCEAGWVDCDFNAANGCEARLDACLVDVCGFTDGGVARTCYLAGVSADAKRVLFESTDSFVPEDTVLGAGVFNLYVYDAPTGSYRWATRYDPDGGQPSFDLYAAIISGDGRRVMFTEFGPLRAGDPSGSLHAYVFDVDTGALALLQQPFDAGIDSEPGPVVLSFDGRYLLESFASLGEIWVWIDRDAGTYVQFLGSTGRSMSSDGRVVASDGLDGFERFDVFTQQDVVVPVPDPLDGFTPGYISLDATGSHAAFELDSFNLPNPSRIYVVGDAGIVRSADGGTFFSGAAPSFSADGRLLAFNEDVPGLVEGRACAVVDLNTGQHVRLPYSAGNCNPLISADGRTLVAGFANTNSLVLIPLAPPP